MKRRVEQLFVACYWITFLALVVVYFLGVVLMWTYPETMYGTGHSFTFNVEGKVVVYHHHLEGGYVLRVVGNGTRQRKEFQPYRRLMLYVTPDEVGK